MTWEHRLIRHDSRDLLNFKRTHCFLVRALSKCDSRNALLDGDEQAFGKPVGVDDA